MLVSLAVFRSVHQSFIVSVIESQITYLLLRGNFLLHSIYGLCWFLLLSPVVKFCWLSVTERMLGDKLLYPSIANTYLRQWRFSKKNNLRGWNSFFIRKSWIHTDLLIHGTVKRPINLHPSLSFVFGLWLSTDLIKYIVFQKYFQQLVCFFISLIILKKNDSPLFYTHNVKIHLNIKIPYNLTFHLSTTASALNI